MGYMYGQNNMKIKVNKDRLLEILRENRDKHEADYSKAKTGFRKLLEKELEKKLQLCRDGKKVELSFKNQKPTNNLKDYDDVIGMLELSTDEELEIDHKQYKEYVKNEWDWAKHWHTSNSAYLSAAIEG